MASGWHVLPLDRRPGSVPQLLVKYSIDTKTGYNVYLTDLTYMWSEILDRRQIISRGLEEDTSIDPSEDASQLKILLEKVRMAFEGAEGTFLELLPREGGDSLVIRANAVLPSPLKPLVWQIYLEPSPPQVLTEKLVLPLLGYHLALRDEVESLIRQVKSKDHVIGKLMDKLELSGMDIGSIFPGIVGLNTGKKGGRWEKAGKLVRGLGPFNEEEWMEEMKACARESKSEDEVLGAIFGGVGAGPFAVEDREITKVGSTNKWWQNLDVPPRGQNAELEGVSTTSRRNRTPGSGSDEFQTQETPPHLRKHAKKLIHKVSPDDKGSPIPSPEGTFTVDDDTTDDDLGALPRGPNPPRPSTVAKQRHKSPVVDSSSEEVAKPKKHIPQPRAPQAASRQKLKTESQGLIVDPKDAPPADHHRVDSETETTSDDGGNMTLTKTKPPLKTRYRDKMPAVFHSPPGPKGETVAANKDKSPNDGDDSPLQPEPKNRPGNTGGKKDAPITNSDHDIESSRRAATQPPKPKAQLGLVRGKKKAATPDVEPLHETYQIASITPTKLKPRLGVVGGKRREAVPDGITESSPTKSGRGGKLGQIGGKGGSHKAAEYTSPPKADAIEQVGSMQKPKGEGKVSSSPPRPTQPTKAATPPRLETEEEKANRRRDELKRQLDAKSKAPVKKKRKF